MMLPGEWYVFFIAFLPSAFTTILLLFDLRMIGQEIKRIGLTQHYKSKELIKMFYWSWTIDLVASFSAISIVIALTAFDLHQYGAMWAAILLRIIAKISSLFVDLLLLLVLVVISETHLKN